MATYTVLNEGAPIVPISLNVVFDVNVQVSFDEDIISNKTGQELDDQIQAYIENVENNYKGNAQWFSVIDQGRDATCTHDDMGPHQEEGYRNYRLHITFSLDATVQQQTSVQTDLTGQEKEDFLQAQSDIFETTFKAERNWIDL